MSLLCFVWQVDEGEEGESLGTDYYMGYVLVEASLPLLLLAVSGSLLFVSVPSMPEFAWGKFWWSMPELSNA